MKTIIERGASWTLEETKMLLQLWGQDFVQRKETNTKRTKEVYEKIADKFNQHGHERTADQVRTRVFNMIAEYRRILKDPNPERMKKCIFFEALHKIYQAKHMDDVKQALDDYEPEYPYSPCSNTISSEKGDDSVSDSEATEGNETSINNSTSNNNITTSNMANNNITSTNATNINTNDNNNGDSNNNNDAEKESHSSVVNNSHTTGGSASKKIKLESQKHGSNQSTNQASSAAASTSTNNNSTTTEHNNAKQNKQAATTQIAPPTVTAGASSSSSSSSSSSQRHQSLLLPTTITPGSSATTSTPIGKFTTAGNNTTPSYININSTKLPIIRTNQLIGHTNGNDATNSHPNIARLPTTAALTSHQLYQAPVNTFDVTSSALLIDRMFAHLSRESENMREWIALEKERLALERVRRQQETEREVRRERVLIDTLMRFQDQWLGFISRLDPGLVKNSPEFPPELKISTPQQQSQQQQNDIAAAATDTSSNAVPNTASAQSSTNSNSTSIDANK